jgi:phage baseplate assembly protein gpV
VRILSPNVIIEAPSGVAITGPVTITGSVTITGDASISGALSVGGDITGSNETLSGTLRAAAVNP